MPYFACSVSYCPCSKPCCSRSSSTLLLLFSVQVFTPMERQPLHPLLINLIFRQIADDVYSDACIRISKVDKAAMRAVLGKPMSIIMIMLRYTQVCKLVT